MGVGNATTVVPIATGDSAVTVTACWVSVSVTDMEAVSVVVIEYVIAGPSL